MHGVVVDDRKIAERRQGGCRDRGSSCAGYDPRDVDAGSAEEDDGKRAGRHAGCDWDRD
ncbi:hypothetical protein OG417_37975 [Actinoallomurus sp. NBC_01490]|jgi:hypothetical protein|uniref:hypothetical protein n=1 Tax=Actinoallomurus sp. NBC_01490 TaxID=2903557 RepID=UPI002E31A454|nr:hypothetical protein [Actinoallomurus sp. NBC_01490]